MKFPEKLWAIVHDCISGAIGWGMDGDRIFIDYDKFQMEYLGKEPGFKTKNVISFVRQLNLYGFRKCSRYSDVHEFRHQYFIRGRPDLIKSVRRKLGYRASINTEKVETSMDYNVDAQDNVTGESSNVASPASSESSVYNMFWNQVQYSYLLFFEWLRSNEQLPPNDSKERRNSIMSKNGGSVSAEDSNGQSSSKDLPKYSANEGNSIVYVPVPVPVQYGWPAGMCGTSVTKSSDESSSSDETSQNESTADEASTSCE